jgi:hypothetical protein
MSQTYIKQMIIKSKLILPKPVVSIDVKNIEIDVHDDGSISAHMSKEYEVDASFIVEDMLVLYKCGIIGSITFIVLGCNSPYDGGYKLFEYELTRYGYRYNELTTVKHKGPVIGGKHG